MSAPTAALSGARHCNIAATKVGLLLAGCEGGPGYGGDHSDDPRVRAVTDTNTSPGERL